MMQASERRGIFSLLLNPWLQAAAVSLLALAVYIRTLAPTVMWYDMGEFATAAYVLGIAHNTGYPLLMLLGKLFTLLPVGDIAYRVNLMSAAFAALTVLLIYIMVYELTARRAAALVASLTLTFSSTLWSNATWATSYDLNAFLTALMLVLLWRWWSGGRAGGRIGREEGEPSGRRRASSGGSVRYLQAAAFIFGLSLGNHRLILGLAPAMAYLLWKGHREDREIFSRRRLGWLAGLFLLGFSVNLYLPLRAAQDPAVNWGDPSDLASFFTMITSGYARSFVNPFQSTASLEFLGRVLTIFPAYEFTAAGLILAAVGAVGLGRRSSPYLVVTLLAVAFTMVMISVYGIHNIFNYFQPIYLVFAIWLGVGSGMILGAIADRLDERLRSSLPSRSLRNLLATALLLTIPLLLAARSFSHLDRSRHRDAMDYAEYMLSLAEPGSIVLADFWSWAPLLYAQVVESKGPEVEITNALSQAGLDQEALLHQLLEAGVTTYLVVGTEDSPRLEIESSRLQLIAPYVVHYYPTATLPLPRFKDLLVPKGAVYRAVPEPPDLQVDAIPPGLEMDYSFAGKLELVGFEIDPTKLQRGDSFRASYYWRLPTRTEKDYWVDVLFTDEQGQVATIEGLPLWLHSHWVGGGAVPTTKWEAGAIMREVYGGLVPRAVEPGIYAIRALVYTSPTREGRIPLLGGANPEEGALLGVLEVEAEH